MAKGIVVAREDPEESQVMGFQPGEIFFDEEEEHFFSIAKSDQAHGTCSMGFLPMQLFRILEETKGTSSLGLKLFIHRV